MSTQPRRICFVVSSPAFAHALGETEGIVAAGGAELQLVCIGTMMASAGWEVVFIGPAIGHDARERLLFEVITVPSLSKTSGKLSQLLRVRDVLRALRRARADVYVSRGLTPMAGILAAYCRRAGAKSVFWFGKDADAAWGIKRRSPFRGPSLWLARHGLTSSDLIVAQTRTQAELLHISTGRAATVIPNLSPWEVTGHRDPPRPPYRVLWMGTHHPKKRPEMVLEIAHQLPEMAFTMVGGPSSEAPELYARIVDLAAAASNVNVVGLVSYSETERYFAEHDFFLCTSMLEGFPNVFLQAWSQRMPVVTSFDPDSIVERHGLGMTRDTSEGLVDALRYLEREPASAQAMGDRAASYVAAGHRPEVIVGAFVAELDALLCGAGAVASAAEEGRP